LHADADDLYILLVASGPSRSAIRQLTERAIRMSDAETTSAAGRRPPPVSEIDRLSYDVIVVARAARAARGDRGAEAGKKTAIISKSCSARRTRSWPRAAARRHGQRQPQRQLQVHYRDTMPRQVPEQLADGRAARQGGPGPRLELEAWGAVFDRPRTARSASGTSAAHYPRLAHVGDRTGLE